MADMPRIALHNSQLQADEMLPPHLVYIIYRDYCSIDSLRHVANMLSSLQKDQQQQHPSNETTDKYLIGFLRVVRDRLNRVTLPAPKEPPNGSPTPNQIQESQHFILHMAQKLQERSSTPFLFLYRVLDFLQVLQDIVIPSHGAWPVWCGKITLESTSNTGTRLRSTARVLLTTPSVYTTLPSLAGYDSRFTRTPSASFRCEPYRMQCVPPYAHLQGLGENDTQVLRPMIHRLTEWDLVAVPALFQPTPLDVRILTTRQVQRRQNAARMVIPLSSTSSLQSEEASSLVCFWHDDRLDDLDDIAYLDYLVQVHKVYHRLHQESSESTRHYEPFL